MILGTGIDIAPLLASKRFQASGLLVTANQQPELAGVFSTFAADTPQIYLDIDRDKAQVLGVAISNPDKPLWPDAGDGTPGTKLDLADYFDEISRKTRHVAFNRSIIKELKIKPTPRNTNSAPFSSIVLPPTLRLLEATASITSPSITPYCLSFRAETSTCHCRTKPPMLATSATPGTETS